jgi:hypothetical protein
MMFTCYLPAVRVGESNVSVVTRQLSSDRRVAVARRGERALKPRGSEPCRSPNGEVMIPNVVRSRRHGPLIIVFWILWISWNPGQF